MIEKFFQSIKLQHRQAFALRLRMNGVVETKFTCILTDGRAGLEGLLDNAEIFLRARGVPQKIIAQMMIALDEIVSNIFHHGVREGEPTVHISLWVEADRLTAQISDDGIAFDPLQRPDPDRMLSAEDRPIGGLGIYLVRQMMDDVRYDHDHGQNHLIFYKSLGLEEPTVEVSAP